MEEILASQRQMLIRRGEPTDKVSDEDLAKMFRRHLELVETWITEQPSMDVLFVDYNELLSDPAEQVHTINQFLGGTLEAEKMISVVDPSLHRQRR